MLNRFELHKNIEDRILISLDPTLYASPLDSNTFQFYVRATTTQIGYTLYKSSDAGQILADNTNSTARINFLSSDYSNLPAGSYSWTLQISSGAVGASGSANAVYPDLTGDLILLDNNIADQPSVRLNLSPGQEYFVKTLRNMLSMEYQKLPGSSYNLPQKLGDEELWVDLKNGMAFFNSFPPIFTSYSYKELYRTITSNSEGDVFAPENESPTSSLSWAILMCAEFHSGLRLQWFEAGKHFRYSDNGISIERVKQADYQSIVGSNILQYLTTILIPTKKSLALSLTRPKGLFSGSISYPRSLTRGLRGTRLGLG